MRKLIAALLALALVFTIALPVLAQDDNDEPEPCPYTPVIRSPLVIFGDHTSTASGILIERSRSMSIRADIPNGNPIGFRWYRDNRVITGETTSHHTTGSTSRMSVSVSGYFHVVVYNVEHPQYYVTSEPVYSDAFRMGFFAFIWQRIAIVFRALITVLVLLFYAFIALPIALLIAWVQSWFR